MFYTLDPATLPYALYPRPSYSTLNIDPRYSNNTQQPLYLYWGRDIFGYIFFIDRLIALLNDLWEEGGPNWTDGGVCVHLLERSSAWVHGGYVFRERHWLIDSIDWLDNIFRKRRSPRFPQKSAPTNKHIPRIAFPTTNDPYILRQKCPHHYQ